MTSAPPTGSTATAVNAGRPPTAPLAVPRLAPQRRWQPRLIWLAVALIAAGGLIAAKVLLSVGSTGEYLAVGKRVEIGTQLTRADLTVVRISVDPSLKPVPANAADRVVGRFAAVALVPGTLLTEGQLTDTAIPGAGKQLVGISLSQDKLPAERIKPGANVVLVITGETNPVPVPNQQKDPATNAPLSIKATVIDVRPGTREGTTLLNVAVVERDGPLVAARAAAGRIVVTLTARS
ncbi:SAF domain-containing protein [Dactylosporangium sucinum]|uniref:SAF domain-containing protein n=1 Tax=Dactylosporangium sucinum TaxID=1424081 RepID=A0A917TK33_9ACTN|nr:SAF domain-containing protein [Dactylosporangium sucinum]GGM23840.1 hypothetical protein GCM10007977_026250 [Dactylosporangium sucinum]